MDSEAAQAFGHVASGAEKALSGVGHAVEGAGAAAAKMVAIGAQVAAPFALVGVGAVAAGAAVAGVSVKMAGDFEHATLALVHGAGESKENLDLVRQGILNMAGAVGEAPEKLAEGMYMIESAGYHGAEGLQVLDAAAKGAKIGVADMGTVSDALTTILKDYHEPASDAAGVTGQLLNTVAQGKMHMQDLAGALGQVLPYTAPLHIGFDQVGAAMATMTSHGVDADRAATAMRFGITSLIEPTKPAVAAMQDLGLSSEQLKKQMASGDMVGAFSTITAAMTKMGATGSKAFQQVQQQIKAGDIEGAMATLNASMDDTSSHEARALGDVTKMFGGARGAILALSLMPNLGEFKANIGSVGTAAQGVTKLQEDWALVNTGLNQNLDKVKAGTQALAITLGNALLPAITGIVGRFQGGGSAIADFGAKLAPLSKFSQTFGAALQGGTGPINAFVQGLAAAGVSADKTDKIFTSLHAAAGKVRAVFDTIKDSVGTFVKDLQAGAGPQQAFADAIGKLGGNSAQVKQLLTDLGNAIGFVKDKILPAVGAVADFVKEHADLIAKVAAGALAISALVDAISKGITVFNTLKTVIGGVKTVFTAFNGVMSLLGMGPIGIAILAIMGLVAVGILVYTHWGQITAFFKSTVGPAFSALGSTVQNVIQAIGQKFSDLGTFVHNAINGAVDFIKSHWQEILVTIIAGPMGLVVLEVAKHWDEIKAKIGEFFSWLGSQAHNVMEKALALGQAIIEGIKNGIAAGVGALKSAVTNAAEGALNAAKSALGIASPSKKFAEVGQNTMDGLANGIKEHAGKPVDEAKKAAQAAADAAKVVSQQARYDATSMTQGVKAAADSITGQYVPSIDQLTLKLHELQAGLTENKGDLSDLRAAYKDARDELYDKFMPAIDAASQAQKKGLLQAYQEQIAALHQQYVPAINAASKQIRDQTKDVNDLKDQIEQLKDSQKTQTDLLHTSVNPALDELHQKATTLNFDYQQASDKLKGAVNPAITDQADRLQGQLLPATKDVTGALDTLRNLSLPDLATKLGTNTTDAQKFADALNALPRNVNIDVNTLYTSGTAPGGGGSAPGGGPAPATWQNPTGSSATIGGLNGQQIRQAFISAAGGNVQQAASNWNSQHNSLPSFDLGGVVPGPEGSPMLAIVHGGETVVPPGVATGGGAGAGGFSQPIIVNVNVDASSPFPVTSATAEQIGRQIEPIVTPAVIRALRMGRITLG